MKLLIATALFPPDIADPAPYIKALATRLSKQHEVTVLTYGTLPETIPGVTLIAIRKDQFVLLRLLQFTRALYTETASVDRALIQNAPATELPALVVGLRYRKKMLIQMSDTKIVYTGWRSLLHQLVSSTINRTITTSLPLPRPEIHPFKPLPENAQSDYEQSWQTHLTALSQHLI